MNRHSYSRKRLIYLEAAVPETLPKDDIGDRVIRALCITFSAMSWRGAFDAPSLLSLADDFEDYITGCDDDFSDADLVKRISGKK